MSVERAASFSNVALEVIGPKKVASQYQLAARAPEGCQKPVHRWVVMDDLSIGLTMAPEPLRQSRFAPPASGLAEIVQRAAAQSSDAIGNAGQSLHPLLPLSSVHLVRPLRPLDLAPLWPAPSTQLDS